MDLSEAIQAIGEPLEFLSEDLQSPEQALFFLGQLGAYYEGQRDKYHGSEQQALVIERIVHQLSVAATLLAG